VVAGVYGCFGGDRSGGDDLDFGEVEAGRLTAYFGDLFVWVWGVVGIWVF
jgi:hypothetical protein